jgi:hypothetical protein
LLGVKPFSSVTAWQAIGFAEASASKGEVLFKGFFGDDPGHQVGIDHLVRSAKGGGVAVRY